MVRKIISGLPNASVTDTIRLMLEKHVSGLPFIDDQGMLVGIVTEKDFLRRPEIGTERSRSRWLDALLGPAEAAAAYVHSHGVKVRDVITRDPVTVGPAASLADAAQLMETRNVKRLPVVDGRKVVGIVSRADLLRALVSFFPDVSASSGDDGAIRDRILSEIGRQSWSAGAFVDVVVRDGVADLWGSIDDAAQRRALQVLVESTPGIRSVRDHLVWKGQPCT